MSLLRLITLAVILMHLIIVPAFADQITGNPEVRQSDEEAARERRATDCEDEEETRLADRDAEGDAIEPVESKQRGNLDTEWCLVPSGDFLYCEENITETIEYDYEIMKYEVTNAQYLQYLREAYAIGDVWVSNNAVRGYYEGDHHHRAGEKRFYALGTEFFQNTSRISYQDGRFSLNYPSGFSEEDYLNHPVVYLTWFGANAFAEHYGLSLPTDHEWEKAARGMTGYRFPWGDEIDGSRANYLNSGDPWDNGTTPVGYYNGRNPGTLDSPSPYGVYDMAGNVLNWTESWYGGSYPNRRVLRGGSWDDSSVILPSWSRYSSSMNCNDSDIGFRCVRR